MPRSRRHTTIATASGAPSSRLVGSTVRVRRIATSAMLDSARAVVPSASRTVSDGAQVGSPTGTAEAAGRSDTEMVDSATWSSSTASRASVWSISARTERMRSKTVRRSSGRVVVSRTSDSRARSSIS